MNRILVITNEPSDLSRLLEEQFGAAVLSNDADGFDADAFDSLCILGGNQEGSLTLSCPLRLCAEKMREQNKPVFCEFLRSIGGIWQSESGGYARGVCHTTHHRMVFCKESLSGCGLADGAVLDSHMNECICYSHRNTALTPILVCHDYVCAHDRIDMPKEELLRGLWALWKLDENTLIAAFRLCNFRKARLAPAGHWQAVINAILSFLAGEKVRAKFAPPVCRYRESRVACAADTDGAVRRGLDWFVNAGLLCRDGRGGVHEGYEHNILAKDGRQLKRPDIRADCTGEVGGAFLFDSLLTGDERSRMLADRLFRFNFDYMQVKDGAHRGMFRWTEFAWETCFQDDVARALLPLLLQPCFDGQARWFENIRAALDYMVDTTSVTGIRVGSTNAFELTEDVRKAITKEGAAPPSAHYNAYYHAVLLLAHRICGDERYLAVAEKGLTTLMHAYPDTARETSETEEQCRLLFPLAVLYGVTGRQEHYDWLCRVSDDLQKRRHSSGGYQEWDTGYKAACSRNDRGECALLANNGDPVADLLYSNNWLPLAYAYAYYVTGEQRFYDLWCSVASFMLSCQIYSGEKHLDGGWTRAFDLKHRESHGVPHDIAWAPCCMETGWTVAEILMGLQFMHVAEKKHGKAVSGNS